MKKTILIIAIVTILLTSMNLSMALGVTPARTTINFEPNMKKTIEVTVIGSETEKDLSVSVSGELAPYIIPSTKKIKLNKKENTKTISYDIELPTHLEPGDHGAEIIILEEGKNNDRETVQAVLAVVTQLKVYVPFPGKYATAKTYISEPTAGLVRFIIPVVSAGEYDLARVRANIDIYNKLGEKIESFNTQTINIPSGEMKEIGYDWKANAPVGNYLAVITLIYDGESRRIETPFNVGTKRLELQEIRTDNFNLGAIAKFEMLIENKWSEPIKEVYIDTKIYDEQRQILSHFKSPVETIAALTKQIFTSYWDTAGFREGTYNTEIEINYENESITKKLQFEVTENELNVIGLGYVISEGGDTGGTNGLVTILIGAVVVLILINLLWFMILRKRLKKK